MPADLLARAAAVPDITAFPTVDELIARVHRLAARHPDVADIRRVGTSRIGEAIPCLTVGEGGHHAVVFGGVHPNEPIGGLTALHLAQSLCTDDELRLALDYTWHIIPCIDPDGTRLNEGWFSGPFDRGHYGREFYRPAAEEQVEWTFPFQYKRAYFDRVLPETLALMRLIDDVKPAFMCSLHNGELGGVYYYLSRPAPELYPSLHALPTSLGLPLDTGEPESPYLERYADAIFRMGNSDDRYDFLESIGLDPLAADGGDSSAAYANRHGTLTLVTEVPYWAHADANDRAPTDEPYSDVLRRRAKGIRSLSEQLLETLAAVTDDVSVESPFLRATKAFAPSLGRIADEDDARAGMPASVRPATVAERFGCADIVHCFRLRYGGMMLRALDGEIGVGHGTPTIRQQRKRLEEIYQEWLAEAAESTQADLIPIRKLVGVQYGAILATAEHAAGG